MAENLVLSLFVLLAATLFLGVYRYFSIPPTAYARRSWPDLIVGNGLLVLLLAGVGLVSGEIYYRFVYDTTDAFGLARVTREWMLKHEKMNRFGFRDNIEYPLDKEPGKRRVTFIGDSFTAGHGVPDVEDRFANRVRHAHPEWEVQVLATNGFDSGEELKLLEHLAGARYQFDIVVLVYCLNDIADISPEWQAMQAKLYSAPPPPTIVAHSFFLDTWYNRLRSSRDPEIAGYYHFVLGAYAGPLWETQKSRIASMASTVRGAGGKFAVVTFPFFQHLGSGYEFTSVHAQLERCFQDLALDHLDLLPIYATQQSRDLVVNARDPHPNERAHAQAAEAISKFLADVVVR